MNNKKGIAKPPFASGMVATAVVTITYVFQQSPKLDRPDVLWHTKMLEVIFSVWS